MGIGAILTILLNILLVPIMGYTGAAWTHLFVYILMVGISYYYGQKQYSVPYDVKKLFTYIAIPVALVILLKFIVGGTALLKLIIGNLFFFGFLLYAIKQENILNEIRLKIKNQWLK